MGDSNAYFTLQCDGENQNKALFRVVKYLCHPSYETTKNFSKGEDLAIAAVEMLFYNIPMRNKIDKSINVEPP